MPGLTERTAAGEELRTSRRALSLRTKVTLLTTASVVTGVCVGLAMVQWWGDPVWPLVLGLGVAAAVVWSLAQVRVLAPLERLVRQFDHMTFQNDLDEPRELRRLPCERTDEVGRIARYVHRLATSSLQRQEEAQALRRDMASRVARSTQRATLQLRRLVHRDPLTELGNRRCLNETLPGLTEEAQRTGHELVCIAIDIDDFKRINDTLGHARGDETLVCLAHLLNRCTRSGDLAVRLGGDEFLVFLPGATLERARQFVHQIHPMFRQRLRTILNREGWADLSIGVALLRRDGCEDGVALVKKADEHLYEAKRGGKGRHVGLSEERLPSVDCPLPTEAEDGDVSVGEGSSVAIQSFVRSKSA